MRIIRDDAERRLKLRDVAHLRKEAESRGLTVFKLDEPVKVAIAKAKKGELVAALADEELRDLSRMRRQRPAPVDAAPAPVETIVDDELAALDLAPVVSRKRRRSAAESTRKREPLEPIDEAFAELFPQHATLQPF